MLARRSARPSASSRRPASARSRWSPTGGHPPGRARGGGHHRGRPCPRARDPPRRRGLRRRDPETLEVNLSKFIAAVSAAGSGCRAATSRLSRITGLEVSDLVRRYGDRVALDGVSLRGRAGPDVRFVGPNGAGKTTAMRIILGVLEADPRRGPLRGAPEFGVRAGPSATCRRSAGCTRRCGCAPVVYLAALHGLASPPRPRTWIERLGLDRARATMRRGALAGQPAARSARRRARARARAPRPRRAVSGLDPSASTCSSGVLLEYAAAGVPVMFSVTSSSSSSVCGRLRSSRRAGWSRRHRGGAARARGSRHQRARHRRGRPGVERSPRAGARPRPARCRDRRRRSRCRARRRPGRRPRDLLCARAP